MFTEINLINSCHILGCKLSNYARFTQAGKALDQIEAKMAFMASERDEERKTLEEKLQQLEELPEQTGGKYIQQ